MKEYLNASELQPGQSIVIKGKRRVIFAKKILTVYQPQWKEEIKLIVSENCRQTQLRFLDQVGLVIAALPQEGDAAL